MSYLTFGSLEIGERFRFAMGWPPRLDPDAPVHTKVSARSYDDGRQVWATAARAAVTLEPREDPSLWEWDEEEERARVPEPGPNVPTLAEIEGETPTGERMPFEWERPWEVKDV